MAGPRLTPVDYDPFASGPRLTPVDFDPFAPSDDPGKAAQRLAGAAIGSLGGRAPDVSPQMTESAAYANRRRELQRQAELGRDPEAQRTGIDPFRKTLTYETEDQRTGRVAAGMAAQRELDRETPDDPLGIQTRTGDDDRHFNALLAHVPTGDGADPRHYPGLFRGNTRLSQREVVDTILQNQDAVRDMAPDAAISYLFGGRAQRAQIDQARRGPLNAPRNRQESISRGVADADVTEGNVSPGDLDNQAPVTDYGSAAAEGRRRAHEVARIRRERERDGYYNGFGGFLRGLGESAIATVQETAGSVVGAVLDNVGLNDTDLGRKAQAMREIGSGRMELANPGYAEGSVPYYLFQGAVAVEQLGGSIAIGAATRDPNAMAAGVMGMQVFAQQYDESRRNGRSPREALMDGAVYGLAEAIPERMALGEIMRPGGSFGARIARSAAVEALQEDFTEAVQIGYDSGVLKENMSWGDAWRRLRDSGIVGGLTGGTVSAAHHAATGGQKGEAIREFGDAEFDPAQIDREAVLSSDPNRYDPGDAANIESARSRAGIVKPIPDNVTQEDIDSPLDTDLISEGKTVIDDAVAGRPSRPRAAPTSRPARTAPINEGDQPGRFPIAGGYMVGDGYGAHRGTHGTHHGVDMFARTGTPFQVGHDFEIVGSHRQAQAHDGRDGGNIATVRIGDTVWMAMHLPNLPRAGSYRAGDPVLMSGDSGSATAANPHIHWQPVNDAARAIYAQGRRAVAAFLTGGHAPSNAGAGGSAVVEAAPSSALPPEQADLSWMQTAAQPAEEAGTDLPVTAPETRLPEPEQVDVGGRPATVEERFEVNGEPGVRLRLEDGTTLEESIARLSQRGVTIPPVRDGSRAAPIHVSSAADLARAGERVNTEPTEAQAESGNYSKAHVRFQGIPITIENPVGSTRRGTDANGQPWETRMDRAAYGYAKGSEAPDGEQADIYIGDNAQSDRAYVIDQYDPETRAFDETKSVLGANSREDALAIYDSGFSDGSGPQRRQGVTEMSVDEFREFLKTPHDSPVAEMQPSEEGGQFNSEPAPAKSRRAPVARGPQSAIRFLRSIGGIRNDGGHDLVKGRNWHKAAPGLIQRGGRSIDEAGEALLDAGYFHNRNPEDRPTEAETLDFIEGALKTPAYRQDDLAEVQAREAKAGSKKANANAEYAVRDIAEERGLNLAAHEIEDAAAYMAAGDTAETALQRALNDASAQVLNILSDETGRDFFDTVAESIYEGDSAEPRGSDEGPEEGRVGPEGGTRDEGERPATRGKSSEDGGEGVESRAGVAPEAEGAQPAVTTATGPQTDLLGDAVEQPKSKTEKPAESETPDMFGTREGDERRALERAGEGRLQSDKKQKAPGEDGGLLDNNATQADIESPKETKPNERATASWVIRNRETGEVVMETFDRKKVDALNTEKYEAVPIQEYLAGLNKPKEEAQPASPVEQAKAALQTALDALNGKTPEAEAATPKTANDEVPVGPARAVDTPEFRAWFGDSKVVDDAGNPLVMYHGTSKGEFIMFDTYASNYGLMGMGGYFTADPDVASSYTKKGQGGAPTVYSVYLSIKNPVDMDAPADVAAWQAQFDGIEEFHEGGDTNEDWYRAAEDLIIDQEYPKWEGAEIMQDGLRGMGFDGITHMGGGRVKTEGPRHRVYVAFDPEQIKSATANRGTFDPNEANMNLQAANEAVTQDESFEPSDEQAAEIAERLQQELDDLGISDRIALQVAKGLLTEQSAQGAYFRRVIQVSLDMATNPSATLGHETIHAMKALGLFTDSEWSALTKAAKADTEIAAIVRKEYARLSPEKQDEEAAAEFFSRWRDERMQAKGFAARAFQRLLDFMGALGRAVAWVKGDRSVKAGTVMRGIESGKIGRRETNAGAFDGQGRPQFQKITRNAFPDANIEASYLTEREFGPPTPRGMKPADYDLFARKLLLDDLQWESFSGNDLPFGFSPDTLSIAKVKIDRLVDGNQQVRDAVRRYKFSELLTETALNVRPESVTQAERNEPAEGAPPRAANIRLDKLESADDIKAALESVASDFGQFDDSRRGVVTHEETQRLASDLDMTVDQLMTRRKGQAFNAHEMFAAREMLLASADNLVTLARKAEGGSDADLVNFRKAWVRHVAIQEQVSGLTAEAGRALNQFKMMAKAGGDLNARMLREIIDVEGGRGDVENVAKAILGFSEDPAKMNRFARDAFKPTWRDKLFELWINGLLSGPATHVVNAVSNTLTALTQIPEFATAATIGKVRSKFRPDTDRILRSEVGARAFGLIHGAKEGAKLAAEALRTGEGSDVLSKMEARTQRAISGVKGEIVRIPGRLLVASDELYKGIARRSDLAAQAARMATKEGLTGDAFRARTAELLADPTDEMIDKANDFARYSTFQRPLGPMGQAITRVINLVPGLRLIVPFIRTPANIFKFTVARTVLAPVMKEVRDEIKAGGSQRDLALARMTLGTGLMAVVMQLAAAGIITGGEPDDDDARRLLRATGWQPYSIKIGNTYYSYQRLDPLATLLGLAADLNGSHENMSDAERANASTTMFHSMLNQLKNKTFLSGIGNLVEAVEDPERFGPSFVGRLAGSVVPAIIAQGNNAYGDTTQRDARSILDRVESRIPGLSNTLPARRDIWGREMVREGGVGPDIASPVWTSQDRGDSVSEELLRAGVNLNVPSRRVGGEELSPETYDQYQEVSGRRLRTAAERLIGSGAWERANDERRVELFDAIKNRVRRQTRRSLGLSHE